ncbi:phage portal protein [Sporolactobacillus shoreae]|nr:phage portal protein [Sporolactobacillus shoreae]
MGLFRWGKPLNDDGRDYFSTAIFSTRPKGKISEQQALKIPAVKAAVDLISDSIATLPIYLYEEQSDQAISKVKDRRVDLLNDRANDYEIAQTLKKQLVKDYLLHGRAFLYLVSDNFYYLEASKVDEECYTNDGITIAEKRFKYHGVKEIMIPEAQIIMINSGSSGVLASGEDILDTALGLINYQNAIMNNGALPMGILKASSRLTQPAIDRLRTSWEQLYSGSKNSGKTVVLEEGLDFKALSLRPNELQMTEANTLMIAEVARLFNMPESLLNAQANKYNSLEQNNLSFLQYCIAPILTNFESSFNQALLTTQEKQQGYYFRFDTSEIIRTTEKEKVDSVSAAFTKGLISFNEARYQLDKPAIEDDYYLLNLGSVIKDSKTGKLTVPNMGIAQDLKKEEHNGEN